MSNPGLTLPPGAKLVSSGDLKLPPGAKLVSGGYSTEELLKQGRANVNTPQGGAGYKSTGEVPGQSSPGYFREAASGLWRGVKGMTMGAIEAAQPRTPDEMVQEGIYSAPEAAPVLATVRAGRAVKHMAQDTLTGLQAGYRARQEALAQGEGIPGQILSTVEQYPMVGPMVQHSEQGGTHMFSPQSIGATTEGATYAASPKVIEKGGKLISAGVDAITRPAPPPGVDVPIGNPIQRTVRAIVGTGEGPMKRTVSKANIQYAKDYADVRTANAEAEAAAREANATANQKALGDLQAQQDVIRQQNEAKIAETAAANQKAAADHAAKVAEIEGKNKAAQEQIAKRAALQQQVLDDSAALAQKVQEKAKAVRAEGSAKYDVVTKAVGDAGVTADQIADLVNHAQDKILAGSHPENVRQFKNILTLQGEAAPVESSMGAITPDSPLYKALVERGVINPAENPVVPFRDLGGYVTELGSRMYDAKNLGDVYAALKYVRDGIQKMRMDIAESKGVGPQLADANKFWANYENTYNNMRGVAYGGGSPVARLVRAVDPPTVKQVLTGTASQRVVDMLAKEDPELGKLAEQIQKNHEASKSLPARYTPQQIPLAPEPKTPNTKPVPQFYEAPDAKIAKQKPLPEPPNLPDTVEAARKARIEDWVEKLRRPTVRSWEIGAAVTGLLGEIFGVGGNYAHAAFGTGLGMLGTLEGLAQIMEKPSVVKWLTKPTARDMAILNEMNPQGKVTVRQAITQSMVKNHVPLSSEMKGFLLPAQVTAIAAANAKNNYSSPEDVMMAMKNGDLSQQEGNRLLQRMRGKGSIVRPMEPPK